MPLDLQDACREIWCYKGLRLKSPGVSALDGTSCGQNKASSLHSYDTTLSSPSTPHPHLNAFHLLLRISHTASPSSHLPSDVHCLTISLLHPDFYVLLLCLSCIILVSHSLTLLYAFSSNILFLPFPVAFLSPVFTFQHSTPFPSISYPNTHIL